MSKNEDYLDDLLSSVSGRDDRKDIADLLHSVHEREERSQRDRENRRRRRDYGTQFYREFEQELSRSDENEDDFIRGFELEIDAEDAEREMDDFPKEIFQRLDEIQKEEEEKHEYLDQDLLNNLDGIMDEAKRRVEGQDGLENFSTGDFLSSEESSFSENAGEQEELPISEEVPLQEEVSLAEDLLRQEEDHTYSMDSQEGDIMPDLSTLDMDGFADAGERILDEDGIETSGEDGDDLLNMLSGLSDDADLSDIGALLKAEQEGAEIEVDGADELEKLKSISELSAMSEQKPAKKKFFSRLADLLFGEGDDLPDTVKEQQDLKSISDENLDALKELDAEEAGGKGKKGKKKPKKEKPKKEKPAKAKKPPKPKKPKKPKEIDTSPPLPKKPVILITVMAASIFALIMLGSKYTGYSNDMSMARELYKQGDYVAAYTAISGTSMKKGDQMFYDSCATLAMVQEEYQAYVSMMTLEQYDMALDSLIRGVGRYDKFYDRANEYGILMELQEIEQLIEQALQEQFNVTPDQARALYAMHMREDYSIGVRQILEELGLR